VVRGREDECAAHYRSWVARSEISDWARRRRDRLSS
jgi:hypothetical protein